MARQRTNERRADIDKAMRQPKQHALPDPEPQPLSRETRHLIIGAAYRGWLRRQFSTIKRAMEVSLLVYSYGRSYKSTRAAKRVLAAKLTFEQQAEVRALIREYQRKVPPERRDPKLRDPKPRKTTKAPS